MEAQSKVEAEEVRHYCGLAVDTMRRMHELRRERAEMLPKLTAMVEGARNDPDADPAVVQSLQLLLVLCDKLTSAEVEASAIQTMSLAVNTAFPENGNTY